MTLAELALPMPHADCRDLALVYPQEVAVALYAIQEEHGDPRHICYGRQLEDGRWMIDGEVLSAVGPGDLFGWITAHMTPELMAQIAVVPLSEAVAVLPPVLQPEPQPEP